PSEAPERGAGSPACELIQDSGVTLPASSGAGRAAPPKAVTDAGQQILRNTLLPGFNRPQPLKLALVTSALVVLLQRGDHLPFPSSKRRLAQAEADVQLQEPCPARRRVQGDSFRTNK